MLQKIKDLSVVRLKDGRVGAVLEVLEAPGMPLSYMVDVGDTGEDMALTITHDEVDEVLWAPED